MVSFSNNGVKTILKSHLSTCDFTGFCYAFIHIHIICNQLMHLSREYKFKFDFIKISPNYEHSCQVPYQILQELLTTKLGNFENTPTTYVR